jgi:futalosine hydrolase
MRAAVALLPGGLECNLSAWEQGAPLNQVIGLASNPVAGKPEDQTNTGPPRALPRLCLPKCGLVLLVCGTGPLASALSLALAVGHKQAEHFIGAVNMGIAGSYDLDAAPVGSVVLVDRECFPEYGVWPEYDESVDGLPENDGRPQPLSFAQGILPTGPVFSRLALDAHNTLGKLGLNCHTSLRTGISATLSGVSGTRGRANRIHALTGALIENMEGFALALGAAALNLPFVQIRSVSNQAGCRPPHTWDFDAAAHALSLTAQNMFAPLSGHSEI